MIMSVQLGTWYRPYTSKTQCPLNHVCRAHTTQVGMFLEASDV